MTEEKAIQRLISPLIFRYPKRDVIRRRSSAKRDLLLESISDEYSSNMENLESEKHFFVFTKNTMQPLRDAFSRVAFCSKRLQSCTEGNTHNRSLTTNCLVIIEN